MYQKRDVVYQKLGIFVLKMMHFTGVFASDLPPSDLRDALVGVFDSTFCCI